jgi:hypothetical protein
MKKFLLLSALLLGLNNLLDAQCVISCSNYAVAPITPSLYPTTGFNAIPAFIPNTDDGYTPPVPIGFNFNYYCTTYSTVLIYTNGLIQFDIGAPSTFPSGYDAAQLIPSPNLPTVLNGIVCFRMDDLDPTVGGSVTYTTIGVSPNMAFVVTYSDVPLFGNSSLLYSGQIILHETTNTIDIFTINAPSGPNLATQGIENATGTLGLPTLVSRNQAIWSGSNDMYRFSPAYAPTAPTSLTGSVSVCQGSTNQYTVTSMPGATLYTWSLPGVWTGTSSTTTINATSGSSGNLSVTASYSCGTSTAATLSVTVMPAPVISITSATPSIFCSGTQVTITTSGAASFTLQPTNQSGLSPFYDTPLVNTVYSVTGTGTNGCVSSPATANITVKETPTITVNSGTLCLGQGFTITPSGANTYTYSSIFAQVTPPTANVFNYSVTGTSTNGCVGNLAISTVTVYALPVLTLTPTRASICVKETTTITATGASNYSWSTNSTSAQISVAPVTNTMYTIIGIDSKGCSNTGSVNINVLKCTGLPDAEQHSGLSVFPNPSNGIYNLKCESELTFSVYNMLGDLILKQTVDKGLHSINLESFPSGTYLLRTDGPGNVYQKMLIKQ